MPKMTREQFEEKIEQWEEERAELLVKMEELADKLGFSFEADHGGHNEYVPEGMTKPCEYCEDDEPDADECEECGGSGKVEVDSSGWQNSYC